MSNCVIHFEDSWNYWCSIYNNAQDYYDTLDEIYENPYMKVKYRGSYAWVYIEEEYYDQEEKEE